MSDHKDHREFGFGDVEARPDIDGSPAGGGKSAETNAGKGSPGGQTDPAHSSDSPNEPRNGEGNAK